MAKSDVGVGGAQADWFEELPENCPPGDAKAPLQLPLYRAVRTWPPTNVDFLSQRFLQPKRQFKGTECRARAVSFFMSAKKCFHLLKLPDLRGGKVVSVNLPAEAGATRVTNKQTGHVAWWRKAEFDPIPLTELVEEE